MKKTSRRDAIALGEPRYYTGVPCKRGHLLERDTLTASCPECHRIICRESISRQRARIRALRNVQK